MHMSNSCVLLVICCCYIIVGICLLVICKYHVHSHPLDSFLIKEIRQIDKTSNIPCTYQSWNHNFLARTDPLLHHHHHDPGNKVNWRATHHPWCTRNNYLMCVCVCLLAMTGISGLLRIQRSKILPTCWICGFVQVDLWNSLGSGFLESASSDFFVGKILANNRLFGFLGGAHIRHSNHRSVMAERSDYMQRAGCRSHGQDDQRNDHLPVQPCDACVNHIAMHLVELPPCQHILLLIWSSLKR